ncbi:unnamed protein product [Chrysoparadoxa australica]
MSSSSYIVTGMHAAARAGKLMKVMDYLGKGTSVNEKDREGCTALMWACWGGHVDVCKRLLDAGADATIVNEHTATALHWASWGGHTEIVKALLKKRVGVDTPDEQDGAPLHYAAKKGSVELTAELIKYGAQVDVFNRKRMTPLHLACYQDKAVVAKMLVIKRASVDSIDLIRRTPLHYACLKNNIKCVQLLLEFKANPDVADEKGRLPEHLIGQSASRKNLKHSAKIREMIGLHRGLTPEQIQEAEAARTAAQEEQKAQRLSNTVQRESSAMNGLSMISTTSTQFTASTTAANKREAKAEGAEADAVPATRSPSPQPPADSPTETQLQPSPTHKRDKAREGGLSLFERGSSEDNAAKQPMERKGSKAAMQHMGSRAGNMAKSPPVSPSKPDPAARKTSTPEKGHKPRKSSINLFDVEGGLFLDPAGKKPVTRATETPLIPQVDTSPSRQRSSSVMLDADNLDLPKPQGRRSFSPGVNVNTKARTPRSGGAPGSPAQGQSQSRDRASMGVPRPRTPVINNNKRPSTGGNAFPAEIDAGSEGASSGGLGSTGGSHFNDADQHGGQEVAYDMALETIITEMEDMEETLQNLQVDQQTNEDVLLNVLKRVDEVEKDLRKIKREAKQRDFQRKQGGGADGAGGDIISSPVADSSEPLEKEALLLRLEKLEGSIKTLMNAAVSEADLETLRKANKTLRQRMDEKDVQINEMQSRMSNLEALTNSLGSSCACTIS